MKSESATAGVKRIRYECWIVIDEYGGVRLTKREGKLAKGERAVFVKLLVPASIFTIPTLRATIEVPEGAGRDITTEIVAAADEFIRGAVGMDVVLNMVTPEDHP